MRTLVASLTVLFFVTVPAYGSGQEEINTAIILTSEINSYEHEAILAYVKESPGMRWDDEVGDMVPENPDYPDTSSLEVASVDLNGDGIEEVVLMDQRLHFCGSGGGCTNHIFQKRDRNWTEIGSFFPGHRLEVSNKIENGYAVIYFFSRTWTEEGRETETLKCSVQENETGYSCP